MEKSEMRDALRGLVGLVLLIGIVWLCVALYTQQFVKYVPVTLQSDRSGLLMDSGADVKMRGVVVGRVGDIDRTDDGVTLQLRMDPDLIHRVPADVTARIVPPTVFGAKYVELVGDTSGDAAPIASGARIANESVTIELNQTFDAVRQSLTRLDAARMNTMLSSTADLLDGRGEQLGSLIADANAVSAALVDEVPAVGRSSELAASLARSYQPATGDLVSTIDYSASIVDNLRRHEKQFNAALNSMSVLNDSLGALLVSNEAVLRGFTSVFMPSTELLKKYAPSLACTLDGVAYNDRLLSAVMGGPDFGGVHRNAHVTFMAQRGLEAYKYPEDLPLVAEASGPNCAGLPQVNGKVPHYRYNSGATAYQLDQDSFELGEVPLGLLLFGGYK